MQGEIDGDARVVVVTGGASGIGRMTAMLLASTGDAVSVWDMNSEALDGVVEEITAVGGRAVAHVVDVRRRDQVNRAADATRDVLGRLDGLVTCAGISSFQDFFKLSDLDWQHMIDVHLTGTFLCIQATGAFMRQQGSGAIVCLSSLAAVSGSAGHVHYAAAKAGIMGLTRALAKELGPQGIRVNCIAPGAIETPMLVDVSPEVLRRRSATPIGRIGQPEDVAHAVKYLLSPEASFVTGVVLNVNGGVD